MTHGMLTRTRPCLTLGVFLAGLGTFGLMGGCSSSILGPQITAPSLPTVDLSTPISVSDGDTSSSSVSTAAGSTVATTPATVAIPLTCSASPARTTFYTGSTVSHAFACTSSVSQAKATGAPSFLTLSASGTSVTATGTATAASSSAWSFLPESASQTGSSVDVVTTVLDASTLSSALTPSQAFDPTNGGSTSNNVEFNLGHKISLNPSWDGAMADVTLTAQSLTTDLHGLSLSPSCMGIASPYLCNGTVSNQGVTQDGDLRLKWPWGAFDQGDYYLTIAPRVLIEGGTTALPSQTFSFTLPIQPDGNRPLNFFGLVSNQDPGAPLTLENDTRYLVDMDISPSSTPEAPVVGLVYPTYNATTLAYLSRLAVDRTKSPANASQALAQINAGSHVNLTGSAQAHGFTIKSLPSGHWLAIGLKTGVGADEVHFRVINDSPSAPSSAADVGLTAFSSTANSAKSVDATSPFTEGTETRVGIAYVRKNATTYFLTIAKANVNQTTKAQILDDARYNTDVSATPAPFEPVSSSSMIDRVRIREAAHAGTSYFYAAYREGTNLKIVRTQTQYSGSYGLTGPMILGSAVFSNASTLGQLQNVFLAIGQYGGAVTPAVTYRDKNGACQFKRASADLATISGALTVSNGLSNCYDPHLHYHAKTGRFVVVYAEQNNSGLYDIKMRQITPGATDTLGTAMIVTADLVDIPIRMTSAFYAGGDWMAVLYRPADHNQMLFHGFHVPGR